MTAEQREGASCERPLLSKPHFGPLSIIAPVLFSSFVKSPREIPLPRRIISWCNHSLVCAFVSVLLASYTPLKVAPVFGNYHVCHIYYP